ncbi:hypothetical protein MY3296_007893 [Beauveria thailandica]
MKDLPTGPVVPGLIGGAIVILLLPLFIFTLGPVSGGHLNPMVTIATFFSRLTTFPRCVLYVAFQTFGSAIAGWLARASLDTRSFIVPGCYIDLSKISVGSAFVIEFVTDLTLILITFGVGLDPRQRGWQCVFSRLASFALGIPASQEIPGDVSAPWSDLISLRTIGYSG